MVEQKPQRLQIPLPQRLPLLLLLKGLMAVVSVVSESFPMRCFGFVMRHFWLIQSLSSRLIPLSEMSDLG